MKPIIKTIEYLNMVNDESLAEHDKRYHGGHYDGGKCNERAKMGEKDKVDELSYEIRSRMWLRRASMDALREFMNKYDDGNHEKEMNMFEDEVNYRQYRGGGLEQMMNNLGERA